MNTHRLSLTIGLIVAVSLAVVGCTHKQPPAPKAKSLVEIDPPALARTWKVDLQLKTEKLTALHLTDEYVFAYVGENESHVFNRASGAHLHTERLKGRLSAGPVVTKDFIVYPSESTLEVYNHFGKFVRSIDIGGTARTGAVLAAGRVVICIDEAGRGRVLFVDPSAAYRDIVPVMTTGALSAKPAVRGGLTFVADDDGKVYAISEDHDAAWALENGAFKTDGKVLADLATDPGTGGNLYVSGTDSKLYAINATTGQLRWTYYSGVSLNTAPVPTGDNVYQFVPGVGVAMIEKAGAASIRSPKWPPIRDAKAFLAEDDKNAYLQANNNHIYCVDRATGKVKFVSSRSDLRIFTANNKDSFVFAGTPNGEIICAAPVLNAGKLGELVMSLAVEAEPLASRE